MTAAPVLPPLDTDLVRALEEAGAHVRARASDRLAAAHDASHYRLAPQLAVRAADAEQVSRVFAVGRARGTSVTFRSGGTSLSGQAVTHGILVDTRSAFRRIEILDEGTRVRAQPGATVRSVNARLSRHGRKLGPDPASEIACTIGGVVANNSSGMSCGIHANAYQTLESAVLVLPSGTTIDTAEDDADELLREHEPRIHRGLQLLRDRVRENPQSVATLRRLHSIKNTMGYGLNSFLDHTQPVRILEHLVIGSEGTLAFVASATFRTLPDFTHRATGLLMFRSLTEATEALPALIEAGFATIELMDAASLRVAQHDPDAPTELRELEVLGHAALLVELQQDSVESLEHAIAAGSADLASLPLAAPAGLTRDEATRSRLWRIRKGLFTAVAGARPSGTTALLEDIAVPVDRLNRTCAELVGLFERFGYEGSVIFGHAKDGNIHFLINERFDDPEKLARYEAFTEALVDLVLSQGGTLKAEHGTGRIMAPYVRRQYGDELYDVMWEVKRLIDPGMLLNPDVVLTEDSTVHTKNLKISPSVEAEVDRCVECGYCEPVCPSRDLTLTPRERIVLRRELQDARNRGDTALVRAIEREYRYDGVQTCAVDGMCQTACPVLINTGDLVRRLREESQPALTRAVGETSAQRWGVVSRLAAGALTAASILPPALSTGATSAARRLLGAERVPLHTADLPRGGRRRKPQTRRDATAVYFPSCTNTLFQPVGEDGVAESLLRLCERAGVGLTTPHEIDSLCCGTPWKSKGLSEGYALMRSRVAAALFLATGGGRLPVVCDASSCTEGLALLLEAAGEHGIRVVDAVAFVDEVVLPHLPPGRKLTSITVHATCSSTHLGVNGALERVAAAAGDRIVVPDDWGCCGFAGDRGMLHPELTAKATELEAKQVEEAGSQHHASLNRTCELGMTRATGQEYRHILQLLDDTYK